MINQENQSNESTNDSLEVVQVHLGVVPGDEALHLGRGEHVQPLGVDDAAEAPDERRRLLLDLRVHAEVCHQVDVADPAEAPEGKGQRGVDRGHSLNSKSAETDTVLRPSYQRHSLVMRPKNLSLSCSLALVILRAACGRQDISKKAEREPRADWCCIAHDYVG